MTSSAWSEADPQKERQDVGRDFARTLLPAVRAAASLARALEGRVPNTPKAGEPNAAKQALTRADTATQETLLAALSEHFPEVCLDAEEDTPTVSRFPSHGPRMVVIDPIDGTLHSYLEGRGPYAVIMGLSIDRVLISGLVALPREGLILAGSRGCGAMLHRPLARSSAARAEADGRIVFVSHDLPAPATAFLESRGYEPVPACGGAIAIAPLIRGVLGGLRVSTSGGASGISVRGRVGTLLAREAGAHLLADDDAPFPADLDTPTRSLRVAAREEDLQLLGEALRVAGLPSPGGG